ncbi:Ack1p [Rhizophagus irregularis DAOM 197198w]|uniref:Ack1p n=1 Tax=Rhizophagus irregularis (strain DAOM 197198w) TaxID=1432141 RepID=A0A015J7P3_RHIIW|nr:Ack1p [Rhizophagus irregularis DAOM 197198w]
MFSLAMYYENGEGTEKNLEKALYWHQKAAENGFTDSMHNLAIKYYSKGGAEKNLEKAIYWYQKAAENGFNGSMHYLAMCYEDVEGTEKNLEKAIYWYQKAAENGFTDSMHNLANRYYSGEGTEKNLEKAIYWYQKAAENGFTDSMHNLANRYYSGEGTEKNLEKAIYWYQKAAEDCFTNSMHNLAMCYENGEGTEKNLEKAIYWYQKAAENGFTDSMHNLANRYYSGEGTEKNLEKAFYWRQKATESNKIDFKNEDELCNICNQLYTNYQWCQQCNAKQFQHDFSKWTNSQLNAKNSYEVLEWIAYDKLSNINYYDKGGFSEIHKAIWLDGPIFIIFWMSGNIIIIVRKNHFQIMSYAKKGCLRKCLSDIIKFKWQEKLQLLKKIVLGLKVIHESNLTHGDFHDGLCKPVNDLQDSDNKIKEIYGVLPYMAPETLRQKPYTPASDIYSFSMIMWEFTSGIPPFNHVAHDHHLILSVCEGKRPEIIENTPKCYIDLMKKCWDSDSSNRPTITMLEDIISEDGNYKYEVPNIDNKLKDDMIEFIESNKTLVHKQVNASIIQSHTQAYYTSRKLTEILVHEKSDCFECIIKNLPTMDS